MSRKLLNLRSIPGLLYEKLVDAWREIGQTDPSSPTTSILQATHTIMNHFQIDFDNENFSGLRASICLEKLFRKVVFYHSIGVLLHVNERLSEKGMYEKS